MATRIATEAKVRKAAVLVASLDRNAADLLLSKLGPEFAEVVQNAAMAIEQTDAGERERVIDEFHRIGRMVPGPCPAGIDLADPAAEQFSPPLCFLREIEEEELLELLIGERPQTIALVLSHLPPRRAGEVLARLDPALQAEVVRRVMDIENTDRQVLKQVEQALAARISRQEVVDNRGAAAGPETVGKILASCHAQTAETILDSLIAHDKPLAERFGYRPLEFEELVRLDDAVLVHVFRTVAPQVAQAALVGAPPALVERILHHMSPEDAKKLRRRLDRPGPIRLSDIEEARRQVAALAARLASRRRRPAALAA